MATKQIAPNRIRLRVKLRRDKVGLKKAVLLSLLAHGLLVAILWFGLPQTIEKPSGVGDFGTIDVHLVTNASNARPGLVAEHPREPIPEAVLTAKGLKTKTAESRQETQGSLAQTTGSKNQVGGEGGTSKTLQQIRNKIERAKFYPLIAKRSRVEGSPLVEFKIKKDGSVDYVFLKESSGSKVLDEAATKTVQQAGPYPFYPEPIVLNIHYALGTSP